MRLFGVDVVADPTSTKTAVSYSSNPTAAVVPSAMVVTCTGDGSLVDLSKDNNQERNVLGSGCRKGKHWTMEEHRRFIEGLRGLGKGNWCGIAKRYVLTKNAAQVASHAQKYFQRQEKARLRNSHRPSIFDLNPGQMDQELWKTAEAANRLVHHPRVVETPCSSTTPVADAGEKPMVGGPTTWETKTMVDPRSPDSLVAPLPPRRHTGCIFVTVPLLRVPSLTNVPTNGRRIEEAPNIRRSVSGAPYDSGPSSEVRVLQLGGEGVEPSSPSSTSHVRP